jgi:hypothetical protein
MVDRVALRLEDAGVLRLDEVKREARGRPVKRWLVNRRLQGQAVAGEFPLSAAGVPASGSIPRSRDRSLAPDRARPGLDRPSDDGVPSEA